MLRAPFTIFVFGHEIKAARYDLFFRAARWCGLEIEAPVLADGTYPFDQLIQWIARLKGERTPGNRRTLPTEDQVRAEAGALAGRGVFLSAPEIAERYALAVEYVEEAELASPGGATASGTDARRLPPDARIGEITAIG